MTFNIIGCGDTAFLWDGKGASIGVNDCEKIGRDVQTLILVNDPSEFAEYRLETIKQSKAKIITDDLCFHSWCKHFGDVRMIHLFKYSGETTLKPSRLYHSATSPFVAMSVAFSYGAKEIVLWGVDMMTHHKFNPRNQSHANEVGKYINFSGALRRAGCPVFVGHPDSYLSRYLPVHQADHIRQQGGK